MEKNGDLLSCISLKMLQLLFSSFFSWTRSKDFFAGLLLPWGCRFFPFFAKILSMPQKEADCFLGWDESVDKRNILTDVNVEIQSTTYRGSSLSKRKTVLFSNPNELPFQWRQHFLVMMWPQRNNRRFVFSATKKNEGKKGKRTVKVSSTPWPLFAQTKRSHRQILFNLTRKSHRDKLLLNEVVFVTYEVATPIFRLGYS